MNDKSNFVNVEAEMLKDTILNFIVPLIALVICVLIGVVFIYPAYKALPLLRADIGSKTVLRDGLRTKKTNLDKLVDFKSIVDENSSLVNKLLVSEALVPELLNQIDQIVKGSGMTVTKLSYSYGAETEDTAYQSVDVSLSSDGSYDQLIVFMRNIEDAARMINVKNFRYSINENEGATVISTNFALSSPFLFVESKAVTDDPIILDISDQKFIDFMNKIKMFKYYDPQTPLFPVLEEAPLVDESANPVPAVPVVPAGIGTTSPGATQVFPAGTNP